jgi:hypothetical protein
MAGFGVLIKFQFHYLHLARGTGRNWSVLAFRFASLPSPPIPATEQALTLWAIRGRLTTCDKDCGIIKFIFLSNLWTGWTIWLLPF